MDAIISRLQIAARELQADPAKGEQAILDPNAELANE
jgi:hypothetical protein